MTTNPLKDTFTARPQYSPTSSIPPAKITTDNTVILTQNMELKEQLDRIQELVNKVGDISWKNKEKLESIEKKLDALDQRFDRRFSEIEAHLFNKKSRGRKE